MQEVVSVDRRTLAIGWTVCNVALTATALVLLLLTLDVPWDGWGVRGGPLASAVIILGLGLLLALRRPGNPIGWLVLATATHFALDDIGSYLDLVLLDRGETITGPLAGLFAAAWVPGMVLLLHAFARFPDGDLPTGWRGRAIAILGPLTIVTVSTAMFIGAELGVEPAGAATAEVPGALFLPLPLYGLTVLSTVVTRFRASTGVRRQQFRWIAYAAVPFVAGFVLLPFVADGGAGLQVSAALNLVGTTLLLAAFAVAILRYRLYELDRIVSRTLAYAALTTVVAAVWIGVALLPTAVIGSGEVSNTTIAIATLAAMAVAQPMRSRIQTVIDRRLHRSRYDARQAIERLGVALADEVDRATMHDRVEATLARTLEPRTVAVWTPGRRSEAPDG